MYSSLLVCFFCFGQKVIILVNLIYIYLYFVSLILKILTGSFNYYIVTTLTTFFQTGYSIRHEEAGLTEPIFGS